MTAKKLLDREEIQRTAITEQEATENLARYYQALQREQEPADITSFGDMGHWQEIAEEMRAAREKGQIELKRYVTNLSKVKKDTYRELVSILSGSKLSQKKETSHPQVQLEIVSNGSCPPLPQGLVFAEGVQEAGCRWLDNYEKFSKYWSPRGYELFHPATGIWTLSGIAGRRVWVPFGPNGEYTPMYVALVSDTTAYTKSTTASIGKRLLKEIDLGWMLSADTITPQKLLSNMAGSLPRNYQSMSLEEQKQAERRYAMSGQVVWYYGEFGQHLDAMTARNGVMADFKGILRRLDDCEEDIENDTHARDLETIKMPYLALLASMTPSDLKPYAGKDAKFWHDGLFARFAFITPPKGGRKRDRFPEGEMFIPEDLKRPLRDWHTRLKEPEIEIEEQRDKKGDVTGYFIKRGDFPREVCTLGSGVVDAYYHYDDALADLVLEHNLTQFSGNYGRMAKKALRIAMLFASLENAGKIEIRHWAKAQGITETWRASLHELYAQMNMADSEAIQEEEELLRLIRNITDKNNKPPTARDLARFTRKYDTPTLRDKLKKLTLAGMLREIASSQSERYLVVDEDEGE